MILSLKGGVNMARGRKKALSLDEQLEQVKTEISEMEQNLKDLKLKKKQLESEIKKEEKDKIISLIEQSGKSFDEVKAFLSNS